MNNKYKLIYEGKAKKVFSHDDLNKVIIRDWIDIVEDESGKLSLNVSVIDNARNEFIDQFMSDNFTGLLNLYERLIEIERKKNGQ